MRLIQRLRQIFATKEQEPTTTFLRSLDADAASIMKAALFIGLFAWLPYLKIDHELNPGRADIVILRLGLSLVCLGLLLFCRISRGEHRYVYTTIIALTYLTHATAYITGSVAAPQTYFGGLVFVLFLLLFGYAPLVWILGILFSAITVFLVTLFWLHPQITQGAGAYMLNDLGALALCLAVLLVIAHRGRYLTWQQAVIISQQKIELSKKAVHLESQLLQREKMAAIGNMASGIVHDFRNPVSVIQSAAEFADDAEINAEKRGLYLKIIRDESARLGQMAQDILDFARGEIKIEKKDVELHKFLEIISDVLEPYFEKKKIVFSVDNKEDSMARIDVARMIRVFINIGANAADVLGEGQNFQIKVFRKDAGILFALRDNGPGVPEAIIPVLFEPFVTEGKSHGTGLGMAISRSIVEAHGGKIWFETVSGGGTTFFVELPE